MGRGQTDGAGAHGGRGRQEIQDANHRPGGSDRADGLHPPGRFQAALRHPGATLQPRGMDADLPMEPAGPAADDRGLVSLLAAAQWQAHHQPQADSTPGAAPPEGPAAHQRDQGGTPRRGRRPEGILHAADGGAEKVYERALRLQRHGDDLARIPRRSTSCANSSPRPTS